MTKPVEITTHAINRYQERVKPSLSWSAARRELLELVSNHGRVLPSLDWVTTTAPQHTALMELCDGVALALSDKTCPRCDGMGYGYVTGRATQCTECEGRKTAPIFIATTVLVRGGMDEQQMQRRRERQANRRARRRMRRKKFKHDGRGIPPEPDYDLT